MNASSESVTYGVTHAVRMLPTSSSSSSEATIMDAATTVVKKQIRICIEGNIGAGKTTLIERLSDLVVRSGMFSEVHVEFEQVDNELLALFNQDPVKYGLEFQHSMMNMRLAMLKRSRDHIEHARQANRSCVVLVDTGPLREFAFTRANELAGNITPTDAQAHIDAFTQTVNALGNIMPEKIILLNPLTTSCLLNIRERNRKYEQNITISYLDHVRNAHETQLTTIDRLWSHVQLYTVALDGVFASAVTIFNLIKII